MNTDEQTRTHPDNLTIAYIAMGAADVLGEATEAEASAVSDRYSGQLGVISAVIQHALMIDCMADEHNGEFTGVFLYDVAEPFGREYAAGLILDTLPDARAIATRLIEANIE